ncbi:MAG: hypothetical protein FJ090_19855 [Deltaproteobacteria bacterium]|nr:hypothetical protein [Deltaproteobacteria bacterium]
MVNAFKQDNYAGVGDYGFEMKRLWCTEAVTAADAISWYPSDTTNQASLAGFSFRRAISSNADAVQGICGIAMETTTAAGFVNVQIAGKYASANVDSGAAVVIGDALQVGGTAGRLVEKTNDATLRAAAICLSTPSGNTADVVLLKHPMFG